MQTFILLCSLLGVQVFCTGPRVQPHLDLASGALSSLSLRAHVQDEGEWTDAKTSQIRRITAQRLLESKTTIPHYYLTVECSVDKLLQMRAQLNSRLAADGKKLSVNDFIIKASALVRQPASSLAVICAIHILAAACFCESSVRSEHEGAASL